jgi:hypothetical protein
MAIAKNVEKRIWDVEGFAVIIRRENGRDVRDDKTGIPMYPYDRATKNAMTVSQWREKFKRHYPGYAVDVLEGSGAPGAGNTKLATIRDSYLDDSAA